jgi:hypothetical protein
MFICLNKLFIYLVAMDPFCKLYGTTDLASLHYVTFIEPFAVLPMDALSFDSEQFTNNSINKPIEEKTMALSCSSKNIFSPPFYCIKKLMKFSSKTYRMKFSSSSQHVKLVLKDLCIIFFTTISLC